MIDENPTSSDVAKRWPAMLFTAPVGAISLSLFRDDLEWLATIAVGVVVVCSGLWSVWFGGYRRVENQVGRSFTSFFSQFLLTWLSGFLLAASWSVALFKAGELWGANNSELSNGAISILPVLLQLCSIVGPITFAIFWSLSTIERIWTPVIDGIPLWTAREAVWTLTAVILIALYCFLAAYVKFFG